MRFEFAVRVYYEDTDAGGVVYYANYLRFMERARTEMLRARGIEQDLLRQEHGVVFAVRRAEIDYIKAARFNDLLQVTVDIIKLGKASISVAHTIHHQHKPEDMLCQASIKIACVNADTFKACALPEHIRMELTRVN